MSNRKEIIEEANELGLEFPSNIPNIKLEGLISEFKGEPIPLNEDAPPGPTIKVEPEISETEIDDISLLEGVSVTAKLAANRYALKRKKIALAKKRAFKTSIVTITNKDNRENDVMTTAYLSFENQYFGMSKNVPLDIPVQLEKALIDIASRCTMTLHKDEIVGGRRTGNKVPVKVKKFAISYAQQPTE